MTDDFSDTPVSISEIKANKSRDGTLWTPRDAVVAWLRDYDSGKIKDVEQVCLIYNYKDDLKPKKQSGYYQSSQDDDKLIGMIEIAKNHLCNCA